MLFRSTRERGLKYCDKITVNEGGAVAPYTGAWIEIGPCRAEHTCEPVAPYTGAWIEIGEGDITKSPRGVAPYTGAWIEIEYFGKRDKNEERSLPTRERGLKWDVIPRLDPDGLVAPYTGAWIEIS